MKSVYIVWVVAAVVGLFFYLIHPLHGREKERLACEQAGGVLVWAPSRDSICLRAERIKLP